MLQKKHVRFKKKLWQSNVLYHYCELSQFFLIKRYVRFIKQKELNNWFPPIVQTANWLPNQKNMDENLVSPARLELKRRWNIRDFLMWKKNKHLFLGNTGWVFSNVVHRRKSPVTYVRRWEVVWAKQDLWSIVKLVKIKTFKYFLATSRTES